MVSFQASSLQVVVRQIVSRDLRMQVNIQIEPQREQAAPPPKPLNVYDAVLVRHPDG